MPAQDSIRAMLINVLFAYKSTLPRGTPYPKLVTDAEDLLWGWKS